MVATHGYLVTTACASLSHGISVVSTLVYGRLKPSLLNRYRIHKKQRRAQQGLLRTQSDLRYNIDPSQMVDPCVPLRMFGCFRVAS